MVRLLVGLFLVAATARAESPLAQWGEERFPPLYREAVQTYVDASSAYRHGEYGKALKSLDAFWSQHPAGTTEWKQFQRATVPLHEIADFGAPPAYAALRMLTECSQWRAKAGKAPPKETVQLTVLLLGRSEAPAPTAREEMRRGTGRAATHSLSPALTKDVLDQAYWLFDEYVIAITKGELGVRRVLVPMPDFRVSLDVQPGKVKLSRAETERIFAAVPQKVARATDWWHVVYPSQVPTAEAFAGQRFVTGGLRMGPKGTSTPCLLSEDLKLLKAPNQDGRHELTRLEREVAVSQWLQHEFFHHLFTLYRDEQLEATSHQWHDRRTWPDDFEGFGEADYYAEALHRRIWKHAEPSLSHRLQHAGGLELTDSEE